MVVRVGSLDNDARIQNSLKYEIIRGPTITGTGNGSDSIVRLGIVTAKRWRVVDEGFLVIAAGASTVAEKVNFGIEACDAGAADDDLFGILTQDNTALKNLAAGDMVSRADPAYLAAQDAETNAGTHAWTDGNPVGFNAWQTKQASLICTKKNVAGSTATVLPYVVIELDD